MIPIIGKAAYPFYGPTVPNEHLYRIALRVRPSPELSVQQVMIAIQFSNPGAFYGNNINSLKAGYFLHIPPIQAMMKIGPEYAMKAVHYQNWVWSKRASRQKLAFEVINTKHEMDTREAPAKIPIEGANNQTTAKTKSSLLELTGQQQAANTTVHLPLPAINTSEEQIATQNIKNAELTGFMAESKQFQTKVNNQIAALQQQNKTLQTQLAQLSQQLKLMTYRILKMSARNPQRGQGTILLENLHKNAVGLSSGVVAMVLLTYLLARTFRSKSNAPIPNKEDMSIPSKLDLARAYIDMGDHSSARSVLQEVVTKGNAEQRKGATDLLGKLNQLQ